MDGDHDKAWQEHIKKGGDQPSPVRGTRHRYRHSDAQSYV